MHHQLPDSFTAHRARHPEPLDDCPGCAVTDAAETLAAVRNDIRQALDEIARVLGLPATPTAGGTE